MEVAVFTTLCGPIMSAAVQMAVNKINKSKVRTSVDSIQGDIDKVKPRVEDYERRSPKDRSVAWRQKIADLRRLLCEIEDCADKFIIKKLTSQEFAREIEKLEAKVKEQTMGIAEYTQQREREGEGEGSSSGSSQGQHDVPSHAGHVLIGIDEPLKDLLALVLPNSNNQQATGTRKVTKVISIVGPGGVGKTCLAEEVFRHPDVQQSFPQRRAFVRATGMHKDGVLQVVRSQLERSPAVPGGSERRFIVVDDVHDQKLGSDVIDELRSKGTGVDDIIIMTATVQGFAESWSGTDGHVYKMTPLSAKLSGELFIDHYRGPGVDMTESVEVGKKCDGVPLAVITWARYWNGNRQRRDTVWSKFGDDSLESMQRVLEHTYDSLPTIDQQTCLLYLSMFRREHTLRRGSLIRRWQAEGAEVGCGGTNDHIEALKNWKVLADWNVVCPIVPAGSANGDQGAKTCRPSGAMLGYISHKASSDEFVIEHSDESHQYQRIRRLSVQTHESKLLKNERSASCLRTLVVSPEKNRGIKAADLDFDKCGLLRVLDLEACSGGPVIQLKVENVCNKLKLLKYLSLRSELIDGYVPQAIAQLERLETLDVGKDKVVRVHVDVILLPELKHLVGKFRLATRFIMKQKFRSNRLETLAGFVTRRGNGFPQLMKHMERLRKVKMFFDRKASAKSLSSRLADAIKAFLPQSAYHLTSDSKNERRTLSIDIQECKQPTSDLLRCLDKATGALYSLKLCANSHLAEFPSFIGNLKGIQKLCISFHTVSWQAIMDGQEHLPHLKYLKLVAKESFSAVLNNPIAGQSPTSVLLIQEGQFKNLERMCLQSKKVLPKIDIQGEALTKLFSLHLISGAIGKPTEVICDGNPANKIPPLKNLEEVALQSPSLVNDITIKNAWHQAARDHPKSPQVLFIEDPHNA